MIRNLKALGLALVAVFALSAMVASAASAQSPGTVTSDGSWTGTGTETGGVGANRLTAFGAFVECPNSTYTVHKFTSEGETGVPKTHPLVPSVSTTATITPHYKHANHKCVATFGWVATIHMNGCDYDLHVGETTGGVNGTYGATVDVTCPPGQSITVTLWTNSAEETAKPTQPMCVLHVSEQKGLKGAHITNTTGGHLGLHGTVEGIKVKKTKPNAHSILCQAEETTTGKFDIDVTVSAKNSAGGATSIEVTHP
jgi:hypothetical protein